MLKMAMGGVILLAIISCTLSCLNLCQLKLEMNTLSLQTIEAGPHILLGQINLI